MGVLETVFAPAGVCLEAGESLFCSPFAAEEFFAAGAVFCPGLGAVGLDSRANSGAGVLEIEARARS
jgi:hypothetical protein